MIPDYDFTVGNTITIAVAIYRNNLKKFLKLSLAAHLWLLIPVYGWARYFAIAAWISKLSFDELTNEINNPNKKQYFSIHSLFLFFVSGLISIIIPVILSYLLTVVVFLFVEAVKETIVVIFSFSEYDIFDPSNTSYPLIALIISSIFFLFSSWFYAKLFVSDLIFIDSEKRQIFYLFNQSRKLIKNSQVKTFKTILLSLVVSLPVWTVGFLIYICLVAITTIISTIISIDTISTNKDLVISSCLLAGLFCAHGLLFPFWQSVKATTFYQLTALERKYNLR